MNNNAYPTRFFVEIAFDGTPFFGWQRQKSFNSVQECIEDVLSRLYNTKISIVGCGRTDTGVHAKQYFFHFDAPVHRENVLFILRKMMPKEVSVLSIQEVDKKAHARYDATSRTYWYFLDQEYDVFRRNMAWRYDLEELNMDIIIEACKLFTQYENYTALCKVNPEYLNHNSKVYEAEWCYFKPEKRVIFKVSSNRFLHSQIRRMVGCLTDIGRGTLSINDLENALAHEKEMKYNRTAPPQGLFLWKINYHYIK